MERRRLFNIFLIVFIDLLGFGLILPLLPFYAESFGASLTQNGLLVASYAAMQIVGSPLLGQLSDRHGRRPILLISIFGTFLGFLLLGFATALWMLFASRIIDGLTGGNISVARAYIVDITDEKNRARGLGLIGAAFGLGFVFGPAIGGALSAYGFAVPAFVAAALAAINLVTVYLWLPESLTEEKRAELAAQAPRAGFSLRALFAALGEERVGPLFNIRLVFALGFNTFQTIFPLFALERLKLDAQQTGYTLAYVGVLIILVQGVAIGRLTRRFEERQLILASTVLTGVALLGWALTPNVLILLIVFIPMALGAGIFNTVINSALSKAVYPEEIGSTLGLSTSMESLARVISPSASGFLLERFGAAMPGLVGAALMALMLPYVWRRLFVKPDAPLPERI